MKNRSYVSKTVDSIVAVLQVLILAFIPIVFESNLINKIIAYIVVGICLIAYNVFLRNKIIDAIVSRQTIDINHLKRTNAVAVFYGTIIPEIRSIECQDNHPDDFELLSRFLIWKNAIYFVSDHFWNDGHLDNVIESKSTSHSIHSIYKNEVVIISKKLLGLQLTNDFSMIIQSYDCSTFKNSIAERIEIIKKISQMT